MANSHDKEVGVLSISSDEQTDNHSIQEETSEDKKKLLVSEDANETANGCKNIETREKVADLEKTETENETWDSDLESDNLVINESREEEETDNTNTEHQSLCDDDDDSDNLVINESGEEEKTEHQQSLGDNDDSDNLVIHKSREEETDNTNTEHQSLGDDDDDSDNLVINESREEEETENTNRDYHQSIRDDMESDILMINESGEEEKTEHQQSLGDDDDDSDNLVINEQQEEEVTESTDAGHQTISDEDNVPNLALACDDIEPINGSSSVTKGKSNPSFCTDEARLNGVGKSVVNLSKKEQHNDSQAETSKTDKMNESVDSTRSSRSISSTKQLRWKDGTFSSAELIALKERHAPCMPGLMLKKIDATGRSYSTEKEEKPKVPRRRRKKGELNSERMSERLVEKQVDKKRMEPLINAKPTDVKFLKCLEYRPDSSRTASMIPPLQLPTLQRRPAAAAAAAGAAGAAVVSTDEADRRTGSEWNMDELYNICKESNKKSGDVWSSDNQNILASFGSPHSDSEASNCSLEIREVASTTKPSSGTSWTNKSSANATATKTSSIPQLKKYTKAHRIASKQCSKRHRFINQCSTPNYKAELDEYKEWVRTKSTERFTSRFDPFTVKETRKEAANEAAKEDSPSTVSDESMVNYFATFQDPPSPPKPARKDPTAITIADCRFTATQSYIQLPLKKRRVRACAKKARENDEDKSPESSDYVVFDDNTEVRETKTGAAYQTTLSQMLEIQKDTLEMMLLEKESADRYETPSIFSNTKLVSDEAITIFEKKEQERTFNRDKPSIPSTKKLVNDEAITIVEKKEQERTFNRDKPSIPSHKKPVNDEAISIVESDKDESDENELGTESKLPYGFENNDKLALTNIPLRADLAKKGKRIMHKLKAMRKSKKTELMIKETVRAIMGNGNFNKTSPTIQPNPSNEKLLGMMSDTKTTSENVLEIQSDTSSEDSAMITNVLPPKKRNIEEVKPEPSDCVEVVDDDKDVAEYVHHRSGSWKKKRRDPMKSFFRRYPTAPTEINPPPDSTIGTVHKKRKVTRIASAEGSHTTTTGTVWNAAIVDVARMNNKDRVKEFEPYVSVSKRKKTQPSSDDTSMPKNYITIEPTFSADQDEYTTIEPETADQDQPPPKKKRSKPKNQKAKMKLPAILAQRVMAIKGKIDDEYRVRNSVTFQPPEIDNECRVRNSVTFQPPKIDNECRVGNSVTFQPPEIDNVYRVGKNATVANSVTFEPSEYSSQDDVDPLEHLDEEVELTAVSDEEDFNGMVLKSNKEKDKLCIFHTKICLHSRNNTWELVLQQPDQLIQLMICMLQRHMYRQGRRLQHVMWYMVLHCLRLKKDLLEPSRYPLSVYLCKRHVHDFRYDKHLIGCLMKCDVCSHQTDAHDIIHLLKDLKPLRKSGLDGFVKSIVKNDQFGDTSDISAAFYKLHNLEISSFPFLCVTCSSNIVKCHLCRTSLPDDTYEPGTLPTIQTRLKNAGIDSADFFACSFAQLKERFRLLADPRPQTLVCNNCFSLMENMLRLQRMLKDNVTIKMEFVTEDVVTEKQNGTMLEVCTAGEKTTALVGDDIVIKQEKTTYL